MGTWPPIRDMSRPEAQRRCHVSPDEKGRKGIEYSRATSAKCCQNYSVIENEVRPLGSINSDANYGQLRQSDVIVVLSDDRHIQRHCGRGNPRVIDRHALTRVAQQYP